MDNRFAAKMEKVLLEMKGSIVERVISDHDEVAALLQSHQRDVIDVAAEDTDRAQLEVFSAYEMKQLRLIDAALTRIKSGTYGNCLGCSKKIPRPRLEAVPHALKCIDCQSKSEKRV